MTVVGVAVSVWIVLVAWNWSAFHCDANTLRVPWLYLDLWRSSWAGGGAFLLAATRHARAFAAAGIVLLSAMGAGAAVLRWLPAPRRRAESPRGVMALSGVTLGLALLGASGLGLGLAGLLHPRLVFAVLVSAGLTGLFHRATRQMIVRLPLPRWRDGTMLLAFPLAALIALDALAVLGPEFFYDALVYHLAAPEMYLRLHKTIWIDTVYLASSPMTPQMTGMLATTVGGEPAARLLNLACILLAGFAAAAIAAVLAPANRFVRWLAFALWISLPVMGFETESAFSDGAWALAMGLGVYWAIGSVRGAPLAVVFAAIACAGKYPAMAQSVPLIAWLVVRSGSRARLLVITALAVLIFPGPWLMRNWLNTGDPVYPFLARWGPGFNYPVEHLHFIAEEWRGYGRAIGMTFPWAVGIHDAGGEYWSETFGPIPLILLPLAAAWWLRGAAPATRRAAMITGAGLFMWMLTAQVSRYLLPSLVPAIGILAAAATLQKGPGRIVSLGSMLAWIWFAPVYRLPPRVVRSLLDDGMRVTTGAMTLPVWRQRTPVGSTHAWLARDASPRSRVLLVQEENGYGMPVRAITNHLYDRPVLHTLARESADLRRMLIHIHQRGISHLLVNAAGRVRHASAGGGDSALPLAAFRTLQLFSQQLGAPAFRSGSISIWRISGPAAR